LARERYLRSWEYTPQKPIRKAFKQKPEQIRQWLKQEYPAIKRRAAKENAILYFSYETGIRSEHQSRRFYAPKSVTPIVQSTCKRFSLNMISAISKRGIYNS
jgi:hypothetical protein